MKIERRRLLIWDRQWALYYTSRAIIYPLPQPRHCSQGICRKTRKANNSQVRVPILHELPVEHAQCHVYRVCKQQQAQPIGAAERVFGIGIGVGVEPANKLHWPLMWDQDSKPTIGNGQSSRLVRYETNYISIYETSQNCPDCRV